MTCKSTTRLTRPSMVKITDNFYNNMFYIISQSPLLELGKFVRKPC